MSIIPGRRTRRELQALNTRFDSLKTENEELRSENQLQALVIDDITSATASGANKYVGNTYKDYQLTIKEIAAKYEGNSEWGVLQTGNIIDVRAAFIIGQGVAAVPLSKKDKNSPEMKFIKAFFDYNDLDREMAQEFAKEAEIEGCFLGNLIWDEKDKMVSLRFRSRVDKLYTIVTDPKDYAWYKQVTWKEEGASVNTTIEEPDFVYVRFGGRVHLPNRPMPKIGKCLTQIESMDKALRDWREINHLFVAPIPAIECENAADAKAMSGAIANINWKLRKMVAIAGKLVFVSPDLRGGSEALEGEIVTNAKMISGTTGCPIGFMGFGDLTTKLGSGSEITSDQITASTTKERMVWTGGYTEVIKKAMAVHNKQSGMTTLDPGKFKVIIPFITAEIWKRIADVYLPMYTADAISLETFLSQVPNIDVDAEMEKQEEKDAAAMERFNKSNLNPENQNQDEEEIP